MYNFGTLGDKYELIKFWDQKTSKIEVITRPAVIKEGRDIRIDGSPSSCV